MEDITLLNISGADKEKKYYILKPVYMAQSTVYVPVDSAEKSLRRAIKRSEAQELIKKIPVVPLLVITNEKLSEQMYRECIRANDCEELVKVIKTIYNRKRKRLQAGRKVTAVDAKYFHIAEESLYGELAVALEMPREEVGTYISEVMDREAFPG